MPEEVEETPEIPEEVKEAYVEYYDRLYEIGAITFYQRDVLCARLR